jgi:hypothetical protein
LEVAELINCRWSVRASANGVGRTDLQNPQGGSGGAILRGAATGNKESYDEQCREKDKSDSKVSGPVVFVMRSSSFSSQLKSTLSNLEENKAFLDGNPSPSRLINMDRKLLFT